MHGLIKFNRIMREVERHDKNLFVKSYRNHGLSIINCKECFDGSKLLEITDGTRFMNIIHDENKIDTLPQLLKEKGIGLNWYKFKD